MLREVHTRICTREANVRLSNVSRGKQLGYYKLVSVNIFLRRVCLSSGKLSLSRRKIIYQHLSVGDLVATQQKRYDGSDFAEEAIFHADLSLSIANVNGSREKSAINN